MKKLTNTIEQIFNAARSALPETLAEEVTENVKAAIKSAMEELDVVSREEFEVQTAVLEKTRKKLQEMEKLVIKLEEKSNK